MRGRIEEHEPSSTSRALLKADSRLSIASSPKLSPGDPSFNAAVGTRVYQHHSMDLTGEAVLRLTDKHSNHFEITVQEFVDHASKYSIQRFIRRRGVHRCSWSTCTGKGSLDNVSNDESRPSSRKSQRTRFERSHAS